jgi:hypothetical protein
MRKTNITMTRYFDGLPSSLTRWLIVAALLLNVGLGLTIAILVAMLLNQVTR